ncbi:MAG: class I SAM-dependent methyltransferase [Candidatus Binatia bacterium]
MEYKEIEKEIRRLSPWYYLFDLHGVRTDITPSFDNWGHRTVDIPNELVAYLKGKTILDVGCNEGGYAFAALRRGAMSVLGFDCRPVNVEKANFVARALGIRDSVFQVGSADSWPPEKKYDIVFMCGILYHLPEPWNTIRKYCDVAREGVFMTTALADGSEGYSPTREDDNIGACENPSISSMAPNTVQTLVAEFAKYGFTPIYVRERKFCYPSSFAVLGWRLSRRLNQDRVRLLNRIGSLTNRIRRYPRFYLNSAPESPYTGAGTFFFQKKSNVDRSNPQT